MSDQHQPRPEFLSHLEWQIQTALQRRDRFAEPVRNGNWTTLRIVLLVLGSVFMGAAGAVATEEVQESRLRDLLLAQIQTHDIIPPLCQQVAVPPPAAGQVKHASRGSHPKRAFHEVHLGQRSCFVEGFTFLRESLSIVADVPGLLHREATADL